MSKPTEKAPVHTKVRTGDRPRVSSRKNAHTTSPFSREDIPTVDVPVKNLPSASVEESGDGGAAASKEEHGSSSQSEEETSSGDARKYRRRKPAVPGSKVKKAPPARVFPRMVSSSAISETEDSSEVFSSSLSMGGLYPLTSPPTKKKDFHARSEEDVSSEALNAGEEQGEASSEMAELESGRILYKKAVTLTRADSGTELRLSRKKSKSPTSSSA